MIPMDNTLANLAASLTCDLLRAGAARLRRLALGSPEEQALRRCYGAALGRSAQAADRRPAIVEALAAALRAPGVRRGVYVLDEEQNIKYLGRLDEALYQALVQVTGAG